MAKIVIFSGAGISQESGIPTFRDKVDGLWNRDSIEKYMTSEGMKAEPEKVYNFHNQLRSSLVDKEPNSAHLALFELEKEHDVTIITQNVDDMHERAGSTNIYHLHGELTKSRSNIDYGFLFNHSDETVELFDLGYDDLNYGDLDEDGELLRPHTVLFGEYPFNVQEAAAALKEADVLLVIGTSLQIGYTIPLLGCVKPGVVTYYVDPEPVADIDFLNPHKIKKTATEGMKEILEILKEKEDENI